ncbi:hypothetical protein [Paenimyroides marinum]|nr:hypothetical protein [Paenimyroides aquimaris]
MRFSTKFIAIVSSSIILVSCSKNDEGQSSQEGDNKGVRLKYFESVQAIGDEVDFVLLPGFELSENSGIRKFGDYQNGVGSYEYNCSWIKNTPNNQGGGLNQEWVNIEGIPHGWDINDNHEKTTKEELLQELKGYEEIIDQRLLEAPYKDHVIVLKKKANEKGNWRFEAYIDPSHRIDGDGQRAEFSSGIYSLKENAIYDVPPDEVVVSVFIQILETIDE